MIGNDNAIAELQSLRQQASRQREKEEQEGQGSKQLWAPQARGP